MKDQIVHFATHHPKRIMWLTLLMTLLAAAMIPRINIDTDPENMLPADQQDRVIHDRIKEQFNLYDLIVVGMVNDTDPEGIYNTRTLSNLKTLSDRIEKLDGVIAHELMSLASVDNITQEGPGTIRFQWMMPDDPKAQLQPEEIRQAVSRLPMFNNTLVSDDGKAAAIYVPIEKKDLSHQISQEIQAIIDQLPPGDDYHITGLPVAEDTFGVEMFIQMAISAPLAALAIFILMWIFFRSFALITAPMLVAMATVITTMGLLIGMGFTVHIMSSMIPIFLMPIAVVDSVHILSEFAELHKPGARVRDTIEEVIRNLFRPMLFTSITSAVGFASLAFTPIPPVQVFGLFVAFGIVLAFLLTIIFVPAYIASLSDARIQKLAEQHHSSSGFKLGGILGGFKSLAAGSAKLVIAAALGLAVFSYYGIQRIEINDNPVRWFKEDHRIRVADRVLNDHFAGTYNAYMVLRKDSSGLQQQYIDQLRQLSRQSPAVKSLVDPIVDREQNFPAMLSAIIQQADNALFDAEGEAVDALEQLMALTEDIQARSKYFATPEALQYIENLQQHLAQQGLVGKSNSFVDLVKTVYRELRGGEPAHYRVPETSNQVAQTVLSYQSSHRPYDLWHFITPDYQNTAVWLQLSSGDNKDMSAVLQQVDDYLQDHPLPDGFSMQWGGLTYINVVWQEAMVQGMLKSLLGAFVMVFIAMVVLFRSLVYGVLAMIPLSLTIALIYGLIGWVGKDYDMPVAVLSSLTLGLSVDFAIHFLDRARSIYQETGHWGRTLQLMFDEPGIAILRNAIVIAIGFLPLLAAPLVPYNTVGIFLASIMATSCIVTLILLPAIMTALQRWLFPHRQGAQS
ncbi:MAG: efflux RND transporter permease subunit [Pseudomonadota bacterium]|nr:efflux RND transporter permease subunit [Pseudomonadota bacterium]